MDNPSSPRAMRLEGLKIARMILMFLSPAMKVVNEIFFLLSDDYEAFRVHEHRDLSLAEANHILKAHRFGKVTVTLNVANIFGSLDRVEAVSVSDDGGGVVVVLKHLGSLS